MSATTNARPQTAPATMPEVPLTVEGYSVLHQMMRFRWSAWRALSQSERAAVLEEAQTVLQQMESQQTALFSLLGHKGDLLFLHFRNSFDEVNAAELKLSQLRLADYLEPLTSYVSVIELGLYESTVKTYEQLMERGLEPHSDEWKQAIKEVIERQREAMRAASLSRYPERPLPLFLSDGSPARRGEELVYRCPCRERQRQMHEHGMVGRRYAGRSEADYHRLHRLRRLGMGSRSVRRRSAGFQEADLRDAFRRSQRGLRIVWNVLSRRALPGRPIWRNC